MAHLDTDLLKPSDVARRLGVSRSWVYDAAASGRIPCVRLGGPEGPVRFLPSRCGELARASAAELATGCNVRPNHRPRCRDGRADDAADAPRRIRKRALRLQLALLPPATAVSQALARGPRRGSGDRRWCGSCREPMSRPARRGRAARCAVSPRAALSLLPPRSSAASGRGTTRRAAPRRPKLKTRGPA